MRAAFVGVVPKEPSFPDDTEDFVALDLDAGRVAISDGASESFDSRTWAALLSAKYVENSSLGTAWIDDAVADYTSLVDYASLSWSQQAAYERGSFATLLGIDYSPGRRLISITCVGDSLAVLLDGAELVASYAYARSEQFRAHPLLLSTRSAANRAFLPPYYFRGKRRRWSLARLGQPVVLCMTDALAAWALHLHEVGEPVWAELTSIDNHGGFCDYVLSARQSRSMRVDDTTLVHLTFNPSG